VFNSALAPHPCKWHMLPTPKVTTRNNDCSCMPPVPACRQISRGSPGKEQCCCFSTSPSKQEELCIALQLLELSSLPPQPSATSEMLVCLCCFHLLLTSACAHLPSIRHTQPSYCLWMVVFTTCMNPFAQTSLPDLSGFDSNKKARCEAPGDIPL
jgi:hypothetical protein